jgi:hypothetical protein
VNWLTQIADGRARRSLREFTLFLPDVARTDKDISWSTMLPPDVVTGWLGVDLDGRQIRITPSRGVTA